MNSINLFPTIDAISTKVENISNYLSKIQKEISDIKNLDGEIGDAIESSLVKRLRVSDMNLSDNEELVGNMCLSYRHDFGMLQKKEQDSIINDCKEWLRAYENNK